jgi:hypothetical protein
MFTINRVLFFVIMLIIVTLSCKRVEHKEMLVLQPCECCLYNDSIEGVYTGSFKMYQFITPYNVPLLSDEEKTVTVTRSFDGLNVLEDSLVCQYIVSDFYDTPIRFNYDNIKSGKFYPQDYRIQYFDLNAQLVVENYGRINLGKLGGIVYYKKWTFHGEKQ